MAEPGVGEIVKPRFANLSKEALVEKYVPTARFEVDVRGTKVEYTVFDFREASSNNKPRTFFDRS